MKLRRGSEGKGVWAEALLLTEKEAAFNGCGLHALIPGSGSIPLRKEGPGKGSY